MMACVRALVIAAAAACAVVIDTAVLGPLDLPGATPSVLLLVVVAAAMATGPLPGAATGFLGGLLADVAPPSVGVVGREALVLCLIGYAAGFAAQLPLYSRAVRWLSGAAIAGAASVCLLVGLSILGEVIGASSHGWVATRQALPSLLVYQVGLSPLIVGTLVSLVRRMEGFSLESASAHREAARRATARRLATQKLAARSFQAQPRRAR